MLIGGFLFRMKSTVAYALVASPGRNRWPSPERNATSYINTDSSDSATPTDGRQSADSLETIELTSTNKLDQPSEAFKTILRDLKKSSHVDNDLYTITDPQEYFRRVANLEGPA
ncbi:hypothetical protein EB796_001369 [Bugula neritina]|uniref:Uncharacterized protein n=1 Tax=Bugula neritina TaxID=10212 RepID=A0A7J7KQ86_BUGNE|nr:hypothetical protein EB796_001369 [Bugula neritina]